MKEIQYFCDLLREAGHNISITTESGRIYVYFDRVVAFSTNANDLGVSNVVVYLSGVWKGISIQTFKISNDLKKKYPKNEINPEDGIRHCSFLLANKTDRDTIIRVFTILKKIDLTKVTDSDVARIVTIFKNIDQLKLYTDDLVSYVLHIIDEYKQTDNQAGTLLKELKEFIERTSIFQYHS